MCLIFYLINKEHRILCTFNLFKISIIVSHLNPNLYFRFFFPSEPRCVKVTCLPPPFHTSSLSSPDIRAAAFSNIVTVGEETEWEHCQHFNTLLLHLSPQLSHYLLSAQLRWNQQGNCYQDLCKHWSKVNTPNSWYSHVAAAERSDIIKIHD